jgi:hypothetical protein
MQIDFDKLVALISTLVTIFALWLAWDGNRRAQRSMIRESTEIIFKEWWSEEIHSIRRYFYEDFIPNHRYKLVGKSMKDIEIVVPEDRGRTRQLCYFFDKVGWLAAAGLIDADYILGPMQHYLRRTWIVMEPLIEKSRIYEAGKPFDPVYQWGFEWLYLRSNRPDKHQARLLSRSFSDPAILTKKEILELVGHINLDEANFHQRIEEIIREKIESENMSQR